MTEFFKITEKSLKDFKPSDHYPFKELTILRDSNDIQKGFFTIQIKR